jgi:hypothetical protein
VRRIRNKKAPPSSLSAHFLRSCCQCYLMYPEAKNPRYNYFRFGHRMRWNQNSNGFSPFPEPASQKSCFGYCRMYPEAINLCWRLRKLKLNKCSHISGCGQDINESPADTSMFQGFSNSLRRFGILDILIGSRKSKKPRHRYIRFAAAILNFRLPVPTSSLLACAI